jgi:hypothetical protein
MRLASPHGLAVSVACFLAAAAWLNAANTPAGPFNRYVGTYELVAEKKLRVFRDGDQLKAQAEGQLAATLKSDRQPGRFSVIEAPFVLQFQEDKAGVIVAVEIAAPNGQKRRYRRLVDGNDSVAAAPLHAFEVDAETSVNARVFNGYTRKPGPNGNFSTETYVVGNGGFIDFYGISDASIDRKTLQDVVRIIAPALARQGYRPTTDQTKTDLLLMIYWGTTGGKHTPAATQSPQWRYDINHENARTLGYEAALEFYSQRDGAWSLFSTRAADLMDELEESRYWVALCAFDFQTARNDKKLRLLWTVRYNLPSVGADFTTTLPQMTDVASRYFGRDTGGLINRPSQDKTGHVELRETKVLGTEPAK